MKASTPQILLKVPWSMRNNELDFNNIELDFGKKLNGYRR